MHSSFYVNAACTCTADKENKNRNVSRTNLHDFHWNSLDHINLLMEKLRRSVRKGWQLCEALIREMRLKFDGLVILGLWFAEESALSVIYSLWLIRKRWTLTCLLIFSHWFPSESHSDPGWYLSHQIRPLLFLKAVIKFSMLVQCDKSITPLIEIEKKQKIKRIFLKKLRL